MKSNLINKNYEKPFLNLKSSNFISKNCSINNLTHRINNQLNLNSFQKNEKLLSFTIEFSTLLFIEFKLILFFLFFILFFSFFLI